MTTIPLSSLQPGQQGRVHDILGEQSQRLREMGVWEGAEVSIAHRGIFGGPLAVRIGRSYMVAMRRTLARQITVELA